MGRQQLLSIWGPVNKGEEGSEIREKDRDSDIDDLLLLTKFNGGNKIAHKTVSYLGDRQVLLDVQGFCQNVGFKSLHIFNSEVSYLTEKVIPDIYKQSPIPDRFYMLCRIYLSC